MSSAPIWMWMWKSAVVVLLLARCINGAATALSVTPSTTWYGDDGTWSAVSLRLGTPPQWVDVMVDTVSSETWAVGPGGCVGSNSLCTSSRGEIFNPTTSSTWQDQGFFSLGIDARFGGSAYANYGLDDITFGSTGVTLPSTIIGSINATSFFLGMFGLGVVPGHFKNITSLPAISGLVETKGSIPSHSYGYTAGATYQQKGTPNSLTLGGYDANRFVPHNVSFNLNPSQNPQTSVNYVSVVSTGTSNTWTSPIQLLTPADRVSAVIDSSNPYLWLPESVCDRFAETLGLSYNSSLELYTFDGNASQHDTLVNSKLSFAFSLSDISASAESVNITLPYAAFDLKLTFPFPALNSSYSGSDNSKYYFPLKRATNQAQYTIGRAFLQEAYLITDYERNTFSVHQAVHPSNPIGSTNIVSITRPSDSTFTSPKGGKNPGSKLTTGAIVGIAIAACVAIALATVLAFCLRHRKHSKFVTPDDEKSESIPPKSFLHRFRRRPAAPSANEVVGCTDYPTEVGADATHERFELPAPLGPAELDSEAGTLDGTTENGSEGTDSNMPMYERARRKIERQQAAAARLGPTNETYPVEKTENDASPVAHYRPPDSDTLNSQSPLVSPMTETHGTMTIGGQLSPLSPGFVSAPTTPISPTGPPPTYRRISPGNVVYAGRLPDNVQLPRIVPRIIGPDGRTVNAEQSPVSPGPGTGTTSTLGSQFTENEDLANSIALYEDATRSPEDAPYSPVSSRSADGSAHGSASISAPTTTTGTGSSNASQPRINIRGGDGGSDSAIVREEDDSKFLRQDVEGLRADIQTREILTPYARRNRLQGEDDLVHIPQPAEQRFSFEEERISGTDGAGTR